MGIKEELILKGVGGAKVTVSIEGVEPLVQEIRTMIIDAFIANENGWLEVDTNFKG